MKAFFRAWFILAALLVACTVPVVAFAIALERFGWVAAPVAAVVFTASAAAAYCWIDHADKQ